MTITVTLIRSGVTEAGLQGRFLGIIDEPLSEEGKTSLIWRAANGIYPGAELVFTSGRSRSLATARIVYPKQPAIVLRELEPYDYGEFAGRSYRELERDPAFVRWLSSSGAASIPGGEAPYTFTSRCAGGFRQIVREAECKGLGQTAVITHLSVIQSILRRYHIPRPLYQDWQVDFGGGFVTSYDTNTGTLTIFEKF